MNIITHLQFGDNSSGIYNRDYTVTGADVHFFRSDDGFNPDSAARCVSIDMTVAAPPKEDMHLQEWFYDNSSLNGRLTFELSQVEASGELSAMRVMEFTDARCYSFGERYDVDDMSLRLFDLKIKMSECVIDGVPFSNGSF